MASCPITSWKIDGERVETVADFIFFGSKITAGGSHSHIKRHLLLGRNPLHGDSPGKNTRLGCHAILQEISPIQGLGPGLPHCRWILYHLSHHGSP